MPKDATSTRNIAVMGHGGDGKTTLCEAMLFSAGAIDRLGKVADGTATLDFDAEEIRRKISISSAMGFADWKGTRINIIDVPGYFDFVGEARGAMHGVDAALIVCSAVSGVSVGTEKAMALAGQAGIARMIVINQMDRENANFDKALASVKDAFGSSVASLVVPIVSGGLLKGCVEVATGKAYEFSGKGIKEITAPANLAATADEMREALTETAAGADEALMEKYFDSGELTQDELMAGLKKGIADGSIAPVVCTAGLTMDGVPMLMDMITAYLPSPADISAAKGKNPKTGDAEERACDPSAPFSAQIFKTLADPFVGKLSLIRVFSGTLSGEMQLYNPSADKSEKAGTLYVMQGKKQQNVDKLYAGDIGALAKLAFSSTGDTLCDAAKPIVYPAFEYPKPCISLAVYAKKAGDEDKVFSGLHRLEEEDPTFVVGKAPDTSETLISGVGELHLEVIINKLKSKFGAEAILVDPRIAYRETIKKTVKVQGRHKKQSGGHGQFGDCWVEFEPIRDSSIDFEFIDKVVGGSVPRQFIPAVEKGLRENLPRGALAGYPLTGVRATLFDGSSHPVDSSEMAFKTAARNALKKGILEANPVLLEPIYKLEITVPDDYMGDIIGDLNRRRGRVMGMNPGEFGQTVVAEVPLVEVFKYATDLRSMTQARGSFIMAFDHYEEVPANIAQKIVENAKKTMEEDEED